MSTPRSEEDLARIARLRAALAERAAAPPEGDPAVDTAVPADGLCHACRNYGNWQCADCGTFTCMDCMPVDGICEVCWPDDEEEATT